jgi:hypothetical protein
MKVVTTDGRRGSGKAQIDPRNGVPRQKVPLDLDEPVLAREPQSVLVGGQDHCFDHLGDALSCPLQAARIELLADPLPTVRSEHAGDDRGRPRVVRRRAHRAAAHESVTEVGNLQVVALRAFPYLVQGQEVCGDDHVVDVLPVPERDVIVWLLDAKIGHRSRRPEYASDVNSVSPRHQGAVAAKSAHRQATRFRSCPATGCPAPGMITV